MMLNLSGLPIRWLSTPKLRKGIRTEFNKFTMDLTSDPKAYCCLLSQLIQTIIYVEADRSDCHLGTIFTAHSRRLRAVVLVVEG